MKVIFLSYYPAYRERAESESRALIAGLGGSVARDLVIVSNNSEVSRPGDLPGPDPRSEFAGWHAGLEALSAYSGPVLFLNDTLCAHHRWSRFDRWRLLRALQGATAQRPNFCLGEINRGSQPLSLLGRPLPFWLSTYCFCLGPTLLEQVRDRFVLPEELFRTLVVEVSQGRIHWGVEAEASLTAHLDAWMTPGPHDHWYRAGAVTDPALEAKVKSILNEFWLSALCLEAGAAPRAFRSLGDSAQARLISLGRRLRG